MNVKQARRLGYLLLSTIIFSCQQPEGRQQKENETLPQQEVSDAGIPVQENTSENPATGFLLPAMVEKYGADFCGICANYRCIQAGSRHAKDAREVIGNICTGIKWFKGCPRYARLDDGSIWQYQDDCKKCQSE